MHDEIHNEIAAAIQKDVDMYILQLIMEAEEINKYSFNNGATGGHYEEEFIVG